MRISRLGLPTIAVLAGSAMAVSMSVVVIAGATAPATAAPSHPSARSHPAAPVHAFPSPGDREASPETGITFRGASPGALGHVVVTGSQSGVHAGRVSALSAGRGSVFQPATPFQPGERVSVRSGVKVNGAAAGSFAFGVARPAPAPASVPDSPTAVAPTAAQADAAHADAATCTLRHQLYNSRPDLHPPAVCVISRKGSTAPGDLFLTPAGDAGVGPGIYDNSGQPIWFRPQHTQVVIDFKVVHLGGEEMLAYFSDNRAGGHGVGEYTLLNDHYQFVAHIGAGNGLHADFHELQITKQGTALIGAYDPVYMDLGHGRQVVFDYVVQEVDFQHGNKVLFEWHALDHVAMSQSHSAAQSSEPYDWFHGNSIAQDNDGNILVSSRNTWVVYKINKATGKVMWELGQPNHATAQFRLSGSKLGWFCYQHDARSNPDGSYTVYDDGGGGPGCNHPARGMLFHLNVAGKVATLVRGFRHSPDIYTTFTGSMRTQSNGDALVGWANMPQVTEFGADGRLRLDLKLDQYSYRAVRSVWHGSSTLRPDMVVQTPGGHPTAFASWSGEADLAKWQLFGGRNPANLAPLGPAVPKSGFETAIPVPAGTAVVEVHGLDSAGNLLPNGISAPEPGSAFFHESSGGPSYLRSDYRMIVGDFGGDSSDDVLAQTPGDGPDYLQISDSAGGWTQSRLPQIARDWRPLVGNFTGDSRDEILWWSPMHTTAYLSRTPLAAPWKAISVPAVHNALLLKHNASRGGPTNDEVLWWDPATENDQIDHYTWPAAGNPTVTRLPIRIRRDFRPATGDFDGNGYADVLWYGPRGTPDWVWYLTGPAHGATTGWVSKAVSINGDYRPEVGHFGPADAFDDVYFFAPGWGSDYLWRGHANRTFSSTNVTNGERGLARVVHTGVGDAVVLWNAGHDLRIVRFTSSRGLVTVRSAHNTVVPTDSRLSVGDFTGPEAGDLYWYSPGPAPERLWEPVLPGLPG